MNAAGPAALSAVWELVFGWLTRGLWAEGLICGWRTSGILLLRGKEASPKTVGRNGVWKVGMAKMFASKVLL